MIVIGITGPIGHGKTTFANALAEIEPKARHFETSGIIVEVTDAWHAALRAPVDPHNIDALNGWLLHLPDVIHDILGIDCSFDQIKINPDNLKSDLIEYQKLIMHAENLQKDFHLASTPITNKNKQAYRPILQWLGGYLVQRVDDAIWYNEIVRRIKILNPEDIKLCTVGGLRFPRDAEVLREVGGVIVKLLRPGYGESDSLDPTERERDSILVDVTVINEGNEQDLKVCAAQLLGDIKKQQIQQIYRPLSPNLR